jgi:hypothetical protein
MFGNFGSFELSFVLKLRSPAMQLFPVFPAHARHSSSPQPQLHLSLILETSRCLFWLHLTRGYSTQQSRMDHHGVERSCCSPCHCQKPHLRFRYCHEVTSYGILNLVYLPTPGPSDFPMNCCGVCSSASNCYCRGRRR